ATVVGTAIVQSNGSWNTSVTLSGNGSHSIVAKDTDAAGNTGTSTPVVFTLSAAPPVANADTLAATEDTPVIYTAAQLIGNDTDVDGDTLTIASVSSGTGGTAVLNGNGTVTFTPNANFHGAASFTYTVSDGTATS